MAIGGNSVDVLVRLLGKDSGFKQMMTKAQLDSASFSQKLQHHMTQAGQAMSRVGKSMTMGVTLPLVALGAGAVTMAAKFETSMNQVQAASGASTAEMKDLSKYAMKMGADTIFSAGEAGQAMLDLAKGGMTAAQIKAGGLAAALDLAAAGDLELAQAAEVTVQAMGMFGIAAKDAASVADALAGGANASTASVEGLALSLQQVGPGARNAGISLQQTVAVLAMFADKGIKGSDAGTSLKTMLTRLVPTTKKAAGAMDRFGLSFVNQKGDIDDITVVAEKLRKRLGGLSDEERTFALAQIFGSDATRAATILMEEGADGVKKYTKATTDKTAADKMAEARTKGFAGTMESLKGSVETVAIALGQVLLPILSDLAKKITGVVNKFMGLSDTQKKWIVIVAAIVAAIGPLLMVFGPLVTVIGALIPVITTVVALFGALHAAFAVGGLPALGAAITAAIGPVGLIIIAIVALVAIFVVLWKKCDWFRNFWIAVWAKVKAVALAFWNWAGPFITTSVSVWWSVVKAVMGFIVGVIKDTWHVVSVAVKWFWGWAGPFIKAAIGLWWNNIKTTMSIIHAVFTRVWPIIVTVVRAAIANIKTGIAGVRTVIAVIRAVWDKVHSAAKTVWGVISGVVKTSIGAIKTTVKGVSAIVGWVRDTFGKVKTAVGGAWDWIKTKTSSVWGAVLRTVSGFVNQIIKIVNYLPGVDIKPVSWGDKNPGLSGPTPLAQGVARVNKPTLALIGEDGPEAVLPLSKPSRMKVILRELGLMSSGPITGMTATGQKPPLLGGIPAFGEGGIVGDIRGFFSDLAGDVHGALGAIGGLVNSLSIPKLPAMLGGFLPSILSTVWASVKGQFRDAFGKRPQIVRNATEHIGDPYVWGGTSPGGFDCSGLLWHAYNQEGISIPRIPVNGGRVISAPQMLPADVLLYSPGAIQEGARVPFGHYRMFAGDGKTIESGGGGVHMDSLANNPPAQIRSYLGLGGITRGLSIAGEGGRGHEEAIIPLDNPRRGAAVMKAAGMLAGSGDTHLNMKFTGPVYATSPQQAQAAGAEMMNGAIMRMAQARRSTNRGTA